MSQIVRISTGGQSRKGTAIWLTGALAVAFFLRAFHLGQASLWNDELYARYYYDLFGPGFLLGTGLTIEPIPPTYYFALAGWMHLFGTSEIAMRSLSLLASMIVVGLVYVLARSLLTRNASLAAVWLAAICPLQIFFGQEARVYAILMIAFTTAMIGIAKFLRDVDADVPPWQGLSIYTAGAVVAVCCHTTMIVVIPSFGLAGLAHLLIRRCRRKYVIGWIAANGLVAVFVLGVIVVLHATAKHGDLAFLQPISLRDIVVALSAIETGALVPPRLPGVELSVLLAALLLVATVMRKLPPAGVTVLVAAPALAFTMMLLASLKQPIVLPRTTLWMTVPLCVALAHGVSARSAVRPYLAIVTALAFGAGLFWQITATDPSNKTPWRQLFNQRGADMRQASAVLLGQQATPLATAYYLPGAHNVSEWQELNNSLIEQRLIPEKLGVKLLSRAKLRETIRANSHVWLLLQWGDVQDGPGLLEGLKPPDFRQDYYCGGKDPCLAALEWK